MIKRKDNVPAEPLKLPLYAQPTSRSIVAPSVLLNPTQTRMIKRKIAYHDGAQPQSEKEVFDKVFKTLKDLGWARVEMHGDTLFLTAVIHHEGHSKLVSEYIAFAKETGIWSIMDFLRWGRKRRPPLKGV